MRLQPQRPRWAVGIIERHDNHILIVLPKGEAAMERKWGFPRGPAQTGESPEEAMRRIGREQLGLHLEVVVGQPPLVERMEGLEAELRYFFCGVSSGEATPGPYAEIRWVSRGHLREYDFEPSWRSVVDWLLNA